MKASIRVLVFLEHIFNFQILQARKVVDERDEVGRLPKPIPDYDFLDPTEEVAMNYRVTHNRVGRITAGKAMDKSCRNREIRQSLVAELTAIEQAVMSRFSTYDGRLVCLFWDFELSAGKEKFVDLYPDLEMQVKQVGSWWQGGRHGGAEETVEFSQRGMTTAGTADYV